MKTPSALLILALLAGAAVGQDTKPAPQPRPRLNRDLPLTATPSAMDDVKDQGPAPFLMEKFIVKDQGGGLRERASEQQREGPFSATLGGSFAESKSGSFLTEIGLWQPVDVMEKDATFKPARTQFVLSAIRVRW